MVPIRIKTFELTLPFYVVKTQAVAPLLGTLFIDAYIMWISPQEYTIRMLNGDKVDIIDHDGRAAAVRLVQDAYLAPMTETIVRCRTNRRGVSMLRPARWRLDKICVAHGVIETESGFAEVRVGNFSARGRMLSTGTLLGVASNIEVLTTVAEEEIKTVASWVQELDLTHLTRDQQAQVLVMLQKYSVLFDGTDIGQLAGPHHDIDTRTARPMHQAPYRAGPHERRVIGEEIERMLKLKVIQPSHSP